MILEVNTVPSIESIDIFAVLRIQTSSQPRAHKVRQDQAIKILRRTAYTLICTGIDRAAVRTSRFPRLSRRAGRTFTAR